ncbi:MAG: alpha/beta hydrolase [Bryobacteraceae bacterium]
MKPKSILLSLSLFALFTVSLPAEERHMPSFTIDVEGHGKPVILVPGLGCSAEVWNETVAHLNAGNFQTHALTLAGFGGTAPIHTDHYVQTVRDDLAAYIKQNHLDHPIIIGHSLGGFLALSLAASYPNLPGKIISVDGLPYLAALINPAITPEGAQNMSAGIRKSIETGSEQQYQAMQRETIASMITSPANIDRELKVDLKSDRNTVAEAMSEMMTTDLRNDISKITEPALVLGSWIAYKDYGATHDSSLALYSKQFEKLPGTKIVMNDTSKHFIQLDAPEWFYAQVDGFIGNP